MSQTVGVGIKKRYFAEARSAAYFKPRQFDREVLKEWFAEYQVAENSELREQIRERVINSSLFWVIVLAGRFANYYETDEHFMDLVQEGNIGLMRAFETYDYTKGFAFSTYSTHWIRMRMMRYLLTFVDTVRRPENVHNRIASLRRQIKIAQDRMGLGEDSVDDLQLHKAILQVKEFDAQSHVQSLDDCPDDDEVYLGKKWLQTRYSDLESLFDQIFLEEAREKIVDYLHRRYILRDVHIFCLRTGLIGDEIVTLESIGEHYGLTRERVRQIEFKICHDKGFIRFVTKLVSKQQLEH